MEDNGSSVVTDTGAGENTGAEQTTQSTTASSGNNLFGNVDTSAVVDTNKLELDQTAVQPTREELFKKFGVKDEYELAKRAEGWRKAVADKANAAYDDDTLSQIATERGLLRNAPENVEFAPDLFTKVGLSPMDPTSEEGQAAYAELHNWMKEHRVSQDALASFMESFVAPVLTNIDMAYAQKYEVHLTPERKTQYSQALAKEWGPNAKNIASEVGNWAIKHLPKELYAVPLNESPGGMKQLRKWYEDQKGPTPITGTAPNPIAAGELQQKLDAVMAKKEMTSTDRKYAEDLLTQIERLS